MSYLNQETQLVSYHINQRTNPVLFHQIEAYAMQSHSIDDLIYRVRIHFRIQNPLTNQDVYNSLLLQALEQVDWKLLLLPIWKKYNPSY